MAAPFLTELDPELAIKGSMDPLGLLPLWSRYGRCIIHNLSLVASSARGFTTLMLGYHFARRLVDERQLPDACFVDAFLTFEQLVAYSRVAIAEDEQRAPGRILGLRRVRNRLREGGRLPIGPSRDAQILSNQRSYGLWALFSGPAEVSGMLDRSAMRLSAEAERLVTKVAYPRFQQAGLRDAREILNLLIPSATASPRTFEPRGRHKDLARALAELHGPLTDLAEREFYLESFACGGPSDTDGLQHALWELVREHNDAHDAWHRGFDMVELEAIIASADRRGHPDLAERLRQIQGFEHVIGPAASLFGYLLKRADTRGVAEVSKDLTAAWGAGLRHVDPEAVAAHLEPVQQLHGEEGRRRFERLALALRDGEWSDVIDLVLAQNSDVMARRRGGPWIAREHDRLIVRYPQEGDDLLLRPAETLRHPYYLTSVKTVGGEILGRDVVVDVDTSEAEA
jgi:hypothetical protein